MAWPASSLLPPSGEGGTLDERCPYSLAQVFERVDAYTDGRRRIRRGCRTLFDPRVLDMEWRQISELGFLHEASKASGRDRRRNGQRNYWELQTAFPRGADRTACRVDGGCLPGRIRG